MTTLRIKEICKQKNMTLEMLANKLGIHRTSLAQAMSRNSFSTTRLEEFAKALNVPVWQLFVSAEEAAAHTDTPNFTCPKCGCRLNILITEKDKGQE